MRGADLTQGGSNFHDSGLNFLPKRTVADHEKPE